MLVYCECIAIGIGAVGETAGGCGSVGEPRNVGRQPCGTDHVGINNGLGTGEGPPAHVQDHIGSGQSHRTITPRCGGCALNRRRHERSWLAGCSGRSVGATNGAKRRAGEYCRGDCRRRVSHSLVSRSGASVSHGVTNVDCRNVSGAYGRTNSLPNLDGYAIVDRDEGAWGRRHRHKGCAAIGRNLNACASGRGIQGDVSGCRQTRHSRCQRLRRYSTKGNTCVGNVGESGTRLPVYCDCVRVLVGAVADGAIQVGARGSVATGRRGNPASCQSLSGGNRGRTLTVGSTIHRKLDTAGAGDGTTTCVGARDQARNCIEATAGGRVPGCGGERGGCNHCRRRRCRGCCRSSAVSGSQNYRDSTTNICALNHIGCSASLQGGAQIILPDPGIGVGAYASGSNTGGVRQGRTSGRSARDATGGCRQHGNNRYTRINVGRAVTNPDISSVDSTNRARGSVVEDNVKE